MTYFSGSKVFGCFEKHPKVVSGALRGGFRAREVFGSFEKRTPGIESSSPKVKLWEKLGKLETEEAKVQYFATLVSCTDNSSNTIKQSLT